MEIIGALLVDAARKWKEGVSAAVEPLGLTTSAYLLLDAFYMLQVDEKTTSSQAAAARIAKLDLNVTAQAMKFLTEHHLVSRTPSATDSRSYEVSLTLAGTQHRHMARSAVDLFEASFFASLQQAHFTEALRTLTK